MRIIPAIDIRKGAGVQLVEGNPEQESLTIPDPVAQFREFVSQGAERIHVVDLDGALDEDNNNRDVIRSMMEFAGLAHVQVGGGVRDVHDIDELIKARVDKVVLGTRAIQDPNWLCWMAAHYGKNRIMAAVDARDGEVMVDGWQTPSGIAVQEAALSVQSCGVSGIIYTDIGRDGHEEGPDVEGCRELAEILDVELLASGGIGSEEHIRELAGTGVDGAIVGTAIHTGSLALKDLF